MSHLATETAKEAPAARSVPTNFAGVMCSIEALRQSMAADMLAEFDEVVRTWKADPEAFKTGNPH